MLLIVEYKCQVALTLADQIGEVKTDEKLYN
jgi:hypothetical protein